MKSLLPCLLLSVAATVALAEPIGNYSREIFSDDFVKDGVLIGITPEGSDHSAVDNVVIEPERDLQVSVKFRYLSDKAKSFNLWFDDKGYKESHAGHICNVNVGPKAVNIGDAKTGNFRNDIYEKKKTPEGLSAEEKEMLKSKNKSLPVDLSLQDWHTLVVVTRGDEIFVSIDGKGVGSFKSEGISHDSKTLISLTTNAVDVQYDDFSIKAPKK